MSDINAFWWSPRNDLQLGVKEFRRNGTTWLRLPKRGKFLYNFGDELTPLLIQNVLQGANVSWRKAKGAELIAVGSIIEYYAARGQNDAIVWGTGLRAPIANEQRFKAISSSLGEVLAVRGAKTRDMLRLPATTQLGDPGVLSARLLEGRNVQGVIGRVSVLPHFRTWGSKEGREFLAQVDAQGFHIIPPNLEPVQVICEIAESEFVYSSSLHGLVVAHSLGVPCRWIEIFGAAESEPTFKYHDYLESVGAPIERRPVSAIFDQDLRERTQLTQVAKSIKERSEELGAGLIERLRSHYV